MRLFTVLVVLSLLLVPLYGQDMEGAYSWQNPQAKVSPTGDLEWAPLPFEFKVGKVVRYIDFKHGDDNNDGVSKDKAWKHHPWDLNATGKARDYVIPGTTYVFKGGVVYRGALTRAEMAPASQPTRLTCDPEWGEGKAVISGAEVVTGWKQGAEHPDIPEAEKVWVADIDFLSHRFWMAGDDGFTRLRLARTPNWEESNPEDVLGEWWTWKKGGTGPNPDDPEKKMIIGEDPRITEYPREYFEDAIVWTKWGFVMGTPVATKVQGVDVNEGKLAFKGAYYGSNRRENVSTGHRYYLENKPHYLDQAGEIWVEKTGDSSARVYLRLADGQDPNSMHIEAARYYILVESSKLENVEISNLEFRFNNRAWDYGMSWFFGKYNDPAAIEIDGTARNVSIDHCYFENVINAVDAQASDPLDLIDVLSICDNDIREIENRGIYVDIASNEDGDGPFGRRVSIMRNRMYRVGLRAERTSNGAGIHVTYPQTIEVAGNMLDRMYGPGIFVFGGKSSGKKGEAPFTRYLIYNNKVTDSLLTCSDWGGIETWQGGPQYVWNNISGNPGGYHNKKYDKFEGSRFGHAYYLDGGFKTYLFNNIAWGKNNDTEDKTLANTAGIQGIIGYQNTFLNNTIYKFREGSRQQRPENGRNKHLGNIFQDISQRVFTYANSRKQASEPNEMDVPDDKGNYAYNTMAWANNVFFDITGNLGSFEESGRWFANVDSFSKALQQRGALTTDVGVMADKSPLANPAEHDFRLSDSSVAIDMGSKTFVPWGLYGVVGEWPFTVNREDPSVVIDEHWYMTKYFGDRKSYMDQPMYPLQGVNVSKDDYVSGPLENWTEGALKLNGKDQYLMLEHAKTVEPTIIKDTVKVPGGWAVVTCPDAIAVGEKFKVKVELPNDIDLGRQLFVQLGYTIPRNWGGIMDVSESQTVTGPGPYEFELESVKKEDEEVKAFVVVVSYCKLGTREDTTRNATVRVAKADSPGSGKPQTQVLEKYGKDIEISGKDIKSPQIYQSNFLIETYIKVEPNAKGVICQKWNDGGYMLKVDEDGKIMFRAGRGDKLDHNSPILRSNSEVADGKWHHVIAESDRTNIGFRIYIDGKLDASGWGIFSAHKVQNEGDFYAGGTPEGENLACTLEFLRISQGTLSDALTTVDELYKWQFDGPQFRDFTSKPRGDKPDAGALEK